MSNGIDIRQNEEKSIAMLAAQRQLYRDAKNFEWYSIIFSLIIPFIISITLFFFKDNYCLIALSGFVTIVSMGYDHVKCRTIKTLKRDAAYIQQEFDLYVFQMQWNKRLFGERVNIDSKIARYSKKILADEKEIKELKDWYTLSVADKPILEGILLCQRENLSWDSVLRERVKKFGIIFLVMLITLVFIIGLFNNETVRVLIIRIVFVVPMINWLLNMTNSLNEDIERLALLDRLINSTKTKKMVDLQEIQKCIFEHRKFCYAIPDKIYKFFKNDDEERENRSVTL